MKYEMIKAMLVICLDIYTIIGLFWAGKIEFFKIPTKKNYWESHCYETKD